MKNLPKTLLLTLLFCLSQISTYALAQNQFDLGALEPGQLLLNISAIERIEVDQDTLNISLQYISTGQDRVALQDDVNSVMSLILELLEDSSKVEYSIEQYQVYMIRGRDNKPSDIDQQVWQAQQSVQLHSVDSDAALDLARQLQESKLTMQNMYYSLSTQHFESVSDSLLSAALSKLQARADAASQSLGKRSAELVEVTVNGSGGQNIAYRGRAMTMMESGINTNNINAPVAQPGKTEVSLNVSARALLSP